MEHRLMETFHYLGGKKVSNCQNSELPLYMVIFRYLMGFHFI